MTNLFLGSVRADAVETGSDVGLLQVGVAEQDAGEVLLRDGLHAVGELEELQLYHLCLKVGHEPGGRDANTR